MTITRYVLPVVAGVMAGIVLIAMGEKAIHYVYTLPAGVDMHDKNALAAAIAQMPVGSFLLLLLNYIICSFIGGTIATFIAGRGTAIPAIVVGISLTLSAIFYITVVPQPLWFCIVNLISYLPSSYLGYLAARRK